MRHAIFPKTIPARDQEIYLHLLEHHQQDLRPKGSSRCTGIERGTERSLDTVASKRWKAS
jgi:hypothetical protein